MTNGPRDRTTGVLLAGGKATRLGGAPKGLLLRGGETIAARTVRLLGELCADVIVVANDATPYADLGVRVVADIVRDAGPLGGLHAAMAHASRPFVLVAGCDMPDVQPALLRLLRDADEHADVVVPVVGGRLEPLVARYATRCRAAVEVALCAGRLKATAFHDAVEVLRLDDRTLRLADPHLRSFDNVNTPEEATARGLDIPGPK